MLKLAHKQFIDQKLVRTSWHQQHVLDCRYAAIEAYDSYVVESIFEDCKFSVVNWRLSHFKHVAFKNCILDDVDFAGSEFMSVSFIDCEWQKVDFSQCKLGVKKLDLTGTKLGKITGFEFLAEHELEYDQAIQLLPQFLHAYGIKIKDIDEE